MKINKKGSFTSFISIIISSIIVLMTILVNAVSIRVDESIITGALTVTEDLVLSEYSQKLQDRYGIFATEMINNKESEIMTILKGVDQISEYKCYGLNKFEDIDIFKRSILEFSKPRVPIQLTLQFLSRFTKLNELISSQKSGTKTNYYNIDQNGNTGYEESNDDIKQSILKFEDIINLLMKIDDVIFNKAVSNEVKKIFSIDQLNELLMNSVPNELFDSDITKNIKSELSITENTINQMSQFLDRIFFNSSNFIYDKVCYEYYIASMFSCKSNFTIVNNNKIIKNDLRNRPINTLYSKDTLELEKILFGFEKSQSNETLSKLSIESVRLILHLLSNVYDKSQKTKDQAVAASLSAAIALASAGTVVVPPEKLEIVIMLLRCIGNSISDYNSLSSGNSIPLLPGKINFNIETFYSDYILLFLLIVPENVKSNRMQKIMRENLFLDNVNLYTGVEVSIKFRAFNYSLKGYYYEK